MDIRAIYDKWNSINLLLRILAGIILAVILALAVPGNFAINLLGDMFIGSLKAIAPFLVFFLIIAALSRSRAELGPQFKVVITLYILSTIIAAVISVVIFFIHPVTVTLDTTGVDPYVDDFSLMLTNLAMSLIENPLSAMIYGNYLGVLFWAVVIGVLLKMYGSDFTRNLAVEVSDILAHVIRLIISFAPIGIFGIVYRSISSTSIDEFLSYGVIAVILVIGMLIVMFVTNPIIVAALLRRNPYPLLLRCLKTSALTAFFTRSSAANIPVNMQLAEDMKLDEDFYSVSIPLGATINMNGAAITVSVLTLVTAFSYGVDVPILMAILLCIMAAVAACGSSGVAGGSLLLVPLACSLFGIPDEIAMQVVAIGFIISVIQDSMETALNSSADIYFTAAADMYENPDKEFNI